MVISRLLVLVSGFGGDFGLIHTTFVSGAFGVFQSVSCFGVGRLMAMDSTPRLELRLRDGEAVLWNNRRI
jgi:hypothetical protein